MWKEISYVVFVEDFVWDFCSVSALYRRRFKNFWSEILDKIRRVQAHFANERRRLRQLGVIHYQITLESERGTKTPKSIVYKRNSE